MIGVVISLPFLGKLADIVPFKYTMICATGTKIAATLLFQTLTRPDTWQAPVIVILLIVGMVSQNLFIDSVFTKNIKRDTRGLMQGFNQFFGSIVILVYSKAGNYLNTNYGPAKPFLFLTALDSVLVVILVILILLGKLN